MSRSANFDPHDDPMRSGIYPPSPATGTWARDKASITTWVTGIASTALCALCGWLWTGFNSHETRLVAVETQQKIDANARTEEQRRLDARLDRMDRKLDEVLMWQRRDLHSEISAPSPSSR